MKTEIKKPCSMQKIRQRRRNQSRRWKDFHTESLKNVVVDPDKASEEALNKKVGE